jgi:hypothetical protein
LDAIMSFHALNRAITHGKVSRWLLITSLLLSAVMMHPSLGALVALGINAIVLLLMRKAAMMEGEERFKRRHRISGR